jgi:hypothetical protein
LLRPDLNSATFYHRLVRQGWGNKKMGSIIQLDHARASSSSRAAKAANLSALNPAADARSVASTEDHHSAGILFLCPHLVTRGTVVPTSDAIASREGQSSTMARKEAISVMRRNLGQFVLKRKAVLSLDARNRLGHTVPMAESDAKAEYEQEFIDRVKSARIATGKKQWQIAELLGIKQDVYKHYEVGRLLPHHLVGRFCLLCSIDPVYLMTGKGPKPLRATHAVEAEAPPIPKPKRARRSRAA